MINEQKKKPEFKLEHYQSTDLWVSVSEICSIFLTLSSLAIQSFTNQQQQANIKMMHET